MRYTTHIQLFFLTVALLHCHSTFGQESDSLRFKVKKGLEVNLKDTVYVVQSDTIIQLALNDTSSLKIKENPYQRTKQFYDSLDKKTSKNIIARNIFDLVVSDKNFEPKKDQKPGLSQFTKSELAFSKYKGKVIHSIAFKQVDILEGSVTDTTKKALSKTGVFVNNIHVNTQKHILKKNLLIREGDIIDPYVLADNERLLRQQDVIRDARIYIQPHEGDKNAVDLIIVTQDVLSIGASSQLTSIREFNFGVYDINALGYAKQFQASYFYNSEIEPLHGYDVTLYEPNLFSSFFSGEIQYADNYLYNRIKLAVGRDFFNPNIEYAGGLETYHTSEYYFFEAYDTLQTRFSANYLDVWVGKSLKLQPRTNLIFTSRYDVMHFLDRPLYSSDSNHFFHQRDMFLVGANLTKRNFMTGNKIFGFGKTEDIPLGQYIGVVTGRQFTEFRSRFYSRVDLSASRYFSNLGYVAAIGSLGSFFSEDSSEDAVLKINGLYFTNMMKLSKYEMRWFVYTDYARGINRIIDQQISLDQGWNNDDFPPLGNEKLSIDVEAAYFLPWYIFGFRFTVFHNFGLNFLNMGRGMFADNTLFPTFGLGLRTLNENLVLPELSFELNYLGKNKGFPSTWSFNVSTNFPELFNKKQVFKPRVLEFK